MILEIRPYTNVGPIFFGMTAEQVRVILNGPYREFKRTPVSKTVTDAFQSLGVFVCYDADRRCSAVETARSSQPVFAGRDLLGGHFGVTCEWLRTLDPELVMREDGLTSFALGIGLYSPGCVKDSLSSVESVIGFHRG
jgi:hypothetical protein